MKINQLENELNISRANIRFYEKEGLLNPLRKENGYREYSDADLAVLKKIIVCRKLGISIADIKKILGGELKLQDAVTKSISSMQSEISRLNRILIVCEEIQDKNISDIDFDEEYYWQKINHLEADGEKFFDISNIDTSGFSKRKAVNIAIVIFTVLFFAGIIYAMLCNTIVRSDNDYYDITIQNEIDTYSTISTVKMDADNDRIYVCYGDATCVNTYNLDGEFLWAVSTPFPKNARGIPYFYVDNGRLIIDWTDTYVYDAVTGEFIEKTYAERLGILDWRDHWDTDTENDVKTASELGYGFDIYDVYKTNADGSINSFIVEKPVWYILTNSALGFIIAMVGAIGICAIMLMSKFKQLKNIPIRQKEIGRTAKAFAIYLKCLFACLVIYSVFNIALAAFGINILLGIFPATVIFIISLIVFDCLSKGFGKAEQRLCGMWRIYTILMFAVTVISETVAICILQ